MRNEEHEDHEHRFYGEWRGWLDRPLRRSPQAAAATMAELVRDSSVQRRRSHWSFAGISAAAALIAAVLLLAPRIPRPVSSPGPDGVHESDTLRPEEVLIWIDEKTPLYMSFQAPGSEAGVKPWQP